MRVFYPDTDGEPMADNTECYEWMVTIRENLEVALPGAFVAANLLWYPVEGHPEIRVAPDVFVAFGRPKGPRGSYKQWEEGGQPPDVVFEFWSPGNTFRQFMEKVATYGRLGVKEYYVYDPQRDDFMGWEAGEHGLTPVPVEGSYTSPLLGIRFEHGAGKLRVFHADGRAFQSFAEVIGRAAAAEREAEAARAQADEAKAQADEAKAQAERLAAKLRALGIDPASL